MEKREREDNIQYIIVFSNKIQQFREIKYKIIKVDSLLNLDFLFYEYMRVLGDQNFGGFI